MGEGTWRHFHSCAPITTRSRYTQSCVYIAPQGATPVHRLAQKHTQDCVCLPDDCVGRAGNPACRCPEGARGCHSRESGNPEWRIWIPGQARNDDIYNPAHSPLSPLATFAFLAVNPRVRPLLPAYHIYHHDSFIRRPASEGFCVFGEFGLLCIFGVLCVHRNW